MNYGYNWAVYPFRFGAKRVTIVELDDVFVIDTEFIISGKWRRSRNIRNLEGL